MENIRHRASPRNKEQLDLLDQLNELQLHRLPRAARRLSQAWALSPGRALVTAQLAGLVNNERGAA